jgi:hypothetical protein
MIINKKIIKMVRFTSSKETGTVRCTKCGGLVTGELQHSGDNYCKGHKTKPLNIARVSESCLAKCDVCKCHPNVIIQTKFGTFCQAHARYI